MGSFLWRVLLIALIIWLLYRVIVTWLKNKAADKGQAPTGQPTAADGLHEMVQDKICSVYLPRNQALMLKQDGQEHYFCSVECKNKFLEKQNNSK